jgi:hypothetical protein
MKKQYKTMANLMSAAIPTTVEEINRPPKPLKPSPSVQQQLVVQLPQETVHALKKAAFDQGTTVRAVLLQALEKAGFPVAADQLVDLRKTKQ